MQQKRVLPQSIIDFFQTEFSELKNKSYGEAISPIIAFIDEMEIIPTESSLLFLNKLIEFFLLLKSTV